MFKGIFIATTALLLVFTLGCSEISGVTKELTRQSSSAGPEIPREADLASKWRMTQMEMELKAGEEISILLKLNDGDKVDGFFYLEKGSKADFQISGSSVFYTSKTEDTSKEVVSDRFSFTASQAQGATYTLTFRNPSDNEKTTEQIKVFLEIIYPIKGSLFIPLTRK